MAPPRVRSTDGGRRLTYDDENRIAPKFSSRSAAVTRHDFAVYVSLVSKTADFRSRFSCAYFARPMSRIAVLFLIIVALVW